MERTIEELCEELYQSLQTIEKLQTSEAVISYLAATKAKEDLENAIKPILKSQKKSYESAHLNLIYQYRAKRLPVYDIPGIKTEAWAGAVLEEKVNSELFNALMEKLPDMKKYILDVKEVDVSAVIIKKKKD